MLTVLIVVHLMIVIALVAVVLLQRSEGGALGVGGGSGGFMTGRGQANVLTRATAILAALFFVTSLALTLIPRWTHGDTSILGTAPAGGKESAPSTLPAKGEGTVLDQLRKLEQQRAPAPQGASTAPATGTPATSTPAPTTPAPTNK